jgi:glycosyltransferase involved in cell wall biosynthesis
MEPTSRSKLAVIGGFTRPRDNIAHGTHHAAYIACDAIARVGGYGAIHVYHENPAAPSRHADLVLPRTPPAQVFDKTQMVATTERYAAIYVANGEQLGPMPHVLRPHGDWAPVICSVGTTHTAPQWQSLLMGLVTGCIRATDAFIFKSSPAKLLFRQTWNEMTDRLLQGVAFPEDSAVITNGVDIAANRPSPELRDQTRRRLRVRPDDVMFLAFSRLSPGTKGDQLALITRWKEVVAAFPQALLVLAGSQVDRGFVMDQRQIARAAGVGDRVLIVENPFELMANARGCLMSAADVFVHLTTGVEEAAPLVVCEAMAHALPVIASDWAGVPEQVAAGREGFLVATRAVPVPAALNRATFAVTDTPVGLAGGRSVVTDFDELVARARLFADPQLRRSMGAAARARAESHTADDVARAYVQVFQQASRAAERAWPSQQQAQSFRPLIDMDRVLAAQTRGRVHATDRVRLVRPENATLLVEGPNPEPPSEVERALAALAGGAELELGHLARLIRGPTDAGSGPTTATDAGESHLRAASRIITRLFNHGVIAPVTPSAT